MPAPGPPSPAAFVAPSDGRAPADEARLEGPTWPAPAGRRAGDPPAPEGEPAVPELPTAEPSEQRPEAANLDGEGRSRAEVSPETEPPRGDLAQPPRPEPIAPEARPSSPAGTAPPPDDSTPGGSEPSAGSDVRVEPPAPPVPARRVAVPSVRVADGSKAVPTARVAVAQPPPPPRASPPEPDEPRPRAGRSSRPVSRGEPAVEPRAAAPEGGLRPLPAWPIVATPGPFAAASAGRPEAARTSPPPEEIGPPAPVVDRPPASPDAGRDAPPPEPAVVPAETRLFGPEREGPAPPPPASVVIESIEIVAEPAPPPVPMGRQAGERGPSGFSDYGAVRSYRYGRGR